MNPADKMRPRDELLGLLPRIGLLHCGSFAQLRTLADPALQPHRITGVHLPRSEPAELAQFDVLLVADRLHPEQRARFQPAILERFDDPGATVVIFGENELETWLPGLGLTPHPTIYWAWRTGEDTGTRTRLPDDPTWQFLTPRAVTWHHHGLLHPPPGARQLVVKEDQGTDVGAILYVDQHSQPASLLVTTMDPVYHHGSGFMPGATQFLYSVIRWAEAQQAIRSAGQPASLTATVTSDEAEVAAHPSPVG